MPPLTIKGKMEWTAQKLEWNNVCTEKISGPHSAGIAAWCKCFGSVCILVKCRNSHSTCIVIGSTFSEWGDVFTRYLLQHFLQTSNFCCWLGPSKHLGRKKYWLVARECCTKPATKRCNALAPADFSPTSGPYPGMDLDRAGGNIRLKVQWYHWDYSPLCHSVYTIHCVNKWHYCGGWIQVQPRQIKI